MNGFYQFTTKIKDTLKLDPFVKTVTYGDIFQVDLNKKTIFPLSHLVVNNVTKESNVMRFNISILAMDIVDVSKEATTDVFIGNDNTQDIWHTQLKVLDRLTELLRRGSIVSDGYKLDGNPTFEQFTERFENYLAGWTVTFDVLVGNDMTICEVGSSGSSCAAAGYVIKDSAGTTLYNGTIASGESSIITVGNSTVENSDASYSASVLAEGSLVLPDITVDVTNSALTVVNTATVVSVQDVTISAPDGTINIKKTGDGTISSQSVPSGATIDYSVADNAITVNSTNGFSIDATDPLNIVLTDGTSSVTPTSVTYSQGQHKVDIVLPATPTASPRSTATLMKTGQTTSYQSNDDGQLQIGRATNFTTLDSAPLHNNGSATLNTTTNRFTDVLGGQTYTNGIMLDWSTWNGSTLNGFRRTISFDTYANVKAEYATLNISGYTGWRIPNIEELLSVAKKNGSAPFNYSPLSISTGTTFFSSTLISSSATYGITNTTFILDAFTIAASRGAFPIKTFSLSTSNVLS